VNNYRERIWGKADAVSGSERTHEIQHANKAYVAAREHLIKDPNAQAYLNVSAGKALKLYGIEVVKSGIKLRPDALVVAGDGTIHLIEVESEGDKGYLLMDRIKEYASRLPPGLKIEFRVIEKGPL